MPRKTNPKNINVGTGAAGRGSVPPGAQTPAYPGVDTVRVHIEDEFDAHPAVAISIADAGGYYTSDNVEGALQEIGGGNAATFANRQNGWIAGGTTTEAGLTVTIDANSSAITNTGLVDVSGLSIALPNNTSRWVYINPNTNVLVASASAPNITTVENVIVGVYGTSGGNVTSKRDGRFFVRNDNRKITTTVRAEGAAADANSEGCFESIEAALLWVDTFVQSGVSAKTVITIRGDVTLTRQVIMDTPGITFQGEDNARLLTSGSYTEMFDLSDVNDTTFKNLTFVCNTAASAAVVSTDTSLASVTFENCIFESGTQDWDCAIRLQNSTQSLDIRIDGCTFDSVDTGIDIETAQRVIVTNSTFDFQGAFGIRLGGSLIAPIAVFDNTVSNCLFTSSGSGDGISVRAMGTLVDNCRFLGSFSRGVSVLAGGQDITVRACYFDGMDDGVYASGNDALEERTTNIHITDNTFYRTQTSCVSLVDYVRFSTVTGNYMNGYNGVPGDAPPTYGVYLESMGLTYLSDVNVSDNTIVSCRVGIFGDSLIDPRASGTLTVLNFALLAPGNTVTIGGVVLTATAGAPGVNQFQIGGSNNATATNLGAAINATTNALYASIARATVSTNVVTVYAFTPGTAGNSTTLASSNLPAISRSGATLANGLDVAMRTLNVSRNDISFCGYSQGTATPEGGAGVRLAYAQNVILNGNHVHDIGTILADDGTSFTPTSGGSSVRSSGVLLLGVNAATVTGNQIENMNSTGAFAEARCVSFLQDSVGVEPMFTFTTEAFDVSHNVLNGANEGIYVQADIGSDPATSATTIRGSNFSYNSIDTNSAIYVTMHDIATFTANTTVGNKIPSGTLDFLVEGPSLVAGSSPSGIVSLIVSDNTLGSGRIQVFGQRSVGTTVIREIDVVRNVVTDPTTSITVGNGTANTTVERINVSDNSVQGDIDVNLALGGGVTGGNFDVCRNTVIGSAILLATANRSIQALRVCGNTVQGTSLGFAPAQGIEIGIGGAASGVDISDNMVRSTESAIALVVSDTIDQLVVTGNTAEIAAASGTATPARPLAVFFSGSSGNASSDWVISDNNFIGGDGSRIQGAGGSILGEARITDNSFSGVASTINPTSVGLPQGAYAGLSMRLGGTGSGAVYRNVDISGNTFRSLSQEVLHLTQLVSASTRGMLNVNVVGNTVSSANTAAYNWVRAVIELSTPSNAGFDPMENVRISENSADTVRANNEIVGTASLAAGGVLVVGAALSDFDVSDNSLDAVVQAISSTGLPTLASGIFMVGTSANNISVSANRLTTSVVSESDTSTASASGITLLTTAAATNVTLEGNKWDGTTSLATTLTNSLATATQLGVFATDIEGLTVVDNTVTGGSVTATSITGDFEDPSVVTLSGNLLNVNLTDNQIADVTMTSTTGGPAFVNVLRTKDGTAIMVNVAQLLVSETDGLGWYHTGSSVNGVSAKNCNFARFSYTAVPAFLFNVTGNISALDVSHNLVVGYSLVLSASPGAGEPLDNFTFVSNQNPSPCQGLLSLSVEPGVGQILGSWVIDNNMASDMASVSAGITVNVFSTIDDYTLRGVSVSGNTMSGTNTGIDFRSQSGNVVNASFDNNHLTCNGTTERGILLRIRARLLGGGADVTARNISISGNKMGGFGGVGGGGTFYGNVYFEGITTASQTILENVRIDSNLITSPRSETYGIWLDGFDGNMTGVSIANNKIQFSAGTDQDGLRFDGGAGANTNFTIMGNSVHDATNAASSAVGFVVANSIIAFNTSTTIVTDDWTAFAAGGIAGANTTTSPNQT